MCLEDVPGLPIIPDDSYEDKSITFQHLNKFSKLLAQILQCSNAERMHMNICKKRLP